MLQKRISKQVGLQHVSTLNFGQQLDELLLAFVLVEAQVFLQHLRGIHGAELGATHGAERGVLVVIVLERFVVICQNAKTAAPA